jgi:Tfp pilus assembly protein FimV
MTLAISHRSRDTGSTRRRPQLYLVPPLAGEAARNDPVDDGDDGLDHVQTDVPTEADPTPADPTAAGLTATDLTATDLAASTRTATDPTTTDPTASASTATDPTATDPTATATTSTATTGTATTVSAMDPTPAVPAQRGARAQLAARAAVIASRASTCAPILAAEPSASHLRHPRYVRNSVRLTRRGRIVVGLVLLGFAVTLAALLAPPSQAATPAGPPRAIVVRSGDTLWSIATAALPREDPGAAVDRVRVFNHLPDNRVYVGEQLLLPRS